MNKKTLAMLVLILAGLAGATALFWPSAHKEARMGDLLFPDIDVNAITTIKVVSPDTSFSIIKAKDRWEVAERGNYAADFDKVARFGRKLTSLTVGRAFDYDADTLARLRLKKPATPGSPKKEMGTLFILSDQNNGELARLHIGADRQRQMPEGYAYPAGQFVRVGDEEKVFLVNRFFDTVDQSPADWLKKSIISVKPELIASIACIKTEGGKKNTVYELARVADCESFSLISGQPVKKTEADKLADALSALTLEDVKKVPDQDRPKGIFLEYRLFDKTVYRIFKSQSQGSDNCQVRIEVLFTAPDSKGAEEEKAEITRLAAVELNKGLGPWIFDISKWRCTTFITDPSALVQDKNGK